jgi:2-polyprenyl-6-methoxyphenol hydroxylase-like FAD-dependent oxidoreductase
MLACQLSLYPNISFRIIDKNACSTKQSRALVVHARTLELFSQLNLADKAISQGNYVDAMNVYFNGPYGLRLDFNRIRQDKSFLTKYPYVLFLEQPMTEEILETYLNEHHIQVERNSEVMDLIDIDDQQVQVTLANSQIIQAKYICACDGARSIVRHKLQIPFSGRTYPQPIFLADCKIDNAPINQNEGAIYSASTGLIAMFPIINGRYRVTGIISNDTDISIENINDLLKNGMQDYTMNIHDCKWISKYHSHHRQVDAFRYRNRYFLLGDAAHIHSPLGGQGMNTGLQDAHNLAWKLAFVLTHNANDNLLDTYHDERYNNAKKLVHTIDRAFTFMSTSNWFIKFCRLYITPYILQYLLQPLFNNFHSIRQKIFLRISQLGITYRSSTIYDYGASAGHFHRDTPVPGDRFPYVIYDPCHYHFVIFENEQTKQMNDFIEFLGKKFSKLIQIHSAQEENLPFKFEGAMLIRPDGYIAYRTKVYNINHFHAYFTQFFLEH